MDLKIAWWNCHLSAPATRATPRKVTTDFFSAIVELLNSNVDILCLCEVNEDNCNDLQALIDALSLQDDKYSSYTVSSFYSKDGNKIDDYGVIYRNDRLTIESPVIDLNSRAEVTQKHLKVGRKVSFKLDNNFIVWIFLCHWQSLNTYAEDDHERIEVAQNLRHFVSDITSKDSNALIAICGDFNNEPFSKPIQMALKASRDIGYVKARSDALFNPFWKLVGMSDLTKNTYSPPGTCASTDSKHMTNWRTFDQIILSSGFLKDGWSFIGSGVEIITYGSSIDWPNLSDHYPVACHLKRITT